MVITFIIKLGFPKLLYYSNNYCEYAQTLLGCSLLDVIKSPHLKLTQSDICDIGLQLVRNKKLTIQTERLAQLHSIGFIHYDLKPDNIMFQNPLS